VLNNFSIDSSAFGVILNDGSDLGAAGTQFIMPLVFTSTATEYSLFENNVNLQLIHREGPVAVFSGVTNGPGEDTLIMYLNGTAPNGDGDDTFTGYAYTFDYLASGACLVETVGNQTGGGSLDISAPSSCEFGAGIIVIFSNGGYSTPSQTGYDDFATGSAGQIGILISTDYAASSQGATIGVGSDTIYGIAIALRTSAGAPEPWACDINDAADEKIITPISIPEIGAVGYSNFYGKGSLSDAFLNGLILYEIWIFNDGVNDVIQVIVESTTIVGQDLILSIDGLECNIESSPGINPDNQYADIATMFEFVVAAETRAFFEANLGTGKTIWITSLSVTRWNLADKSTLIGLSNGDLTATHSGTDVNSWATVRATNGKTSGKWYFECISDFIESEGAGVGIATADAILESILGVDPYGYGFFANATIVHDGANSPFGDPWSAADVICVAVDLDLGMIWFRRGIEAWMGAGDPEAGTSPAFNVTISGSTIPYVPAASLLYEDTNINGRFTASTLSYPYNVPAGFTPWGDA
jgi:hypothetical protein